MLSQWTDSAAAVAAGWALVHFLWQGALIAAALRAAAASPGLTAKARYGLACAALGLMPAVFVGTAVVSLPAAGEPGMAAQAVAGTGVAVVTSGAEPWSGAPGWPGWIVPFWMAGVVAFWARGAGGWFAARRLCRTEVSAAPREWQEKVSAMAARMGLNRAVVVLESRLIEAPAVIGMLRPVILAPVGLLAGMPAAQVEAILLHELAHIRRHDYLVNLAQHVVEGLLFFHPAVWWVSGVVRSLREHCSDDAAVAQYGDARGYAAALAAVEERRVSEPALAASGGALGRRIRRLLGLEEANVRMPAPVAATSLVVVLLGVALAGSQAPGAGEGPAVTASTSQWKWLEEDAAYIATKEEAEAYRGLTTEVERARFIEEFWAQRDPTPGTPENERKREHYRRITTANERFAAGVAGWKTDRGRIYILYGAPDEIEQQASRPAEGGRGLVWTVPIQIWRYRYMEGIGSNVQFRFVDWDWSGGFRIDTGAGSPEPAR